MDIILIIIIIITYKTIFSYLDLIYQEVKIKDSSTFLKYKKFKSGFIKIIPILLFIQK